MPVTLIINGKPLRNPDASCLTQEAGRVRQGGAFTMGDNLRDGLMESAAELRGITKPSGDPGEAQRRPRLLYRDALQQLEVKGHIKAVQVQAGREIGRVHEALMSGGPQIAQSRYGEVVRGGGDEDIPRALMPAFRHRYRPWLEWVRHRPASRRSQRSMLDVTLLVCAENLGHEQVAAVLEMDRRTALCALQQSLWQYCLIAGWESEEAA